MPPSLKPGDCVRLPDGRIGRLRDRHGNRWRVRVRRKTSATHQFLTFDAEELEVVDCPKGWMSPGGYERYLKQTLAKMAERQRKAKPAPKRRGGGKKRST